MPIDCSAILAIAKELAAVDNEAHRRSAISRAYYASMHCVVAALPSQFAVAEADKRSSRSHEAVIQAIGAWGKSIAPGRQNARYAAMKLPKLKAARKQADYDLHDSVSSSATEQAIEMADEVFQLMAETSNREQTAQG